MHKTQTIEQRFWNKVQKTNNCWYWIGAQRGIAAKERKGYGHMYIDGHSAGAHRISWMIHHIGEKIPEGMCVLHHCDNPPCVNPDHLFLGTVKDNSIDMSNKRRQVFQKHPNKIPRGDRHGTHTHPETFPRGESVKISKLTEQQVREMFSRVKSGESRNSVFRHYSISRGTIDHIMEGHTWKHLKLLDL